MPGVSELPLIARARTHAGRTAIVAAEGTFAYTDLLDASTRVAASLLNGRPDLGEARVALLAPAGWHYVACQWGIWRAGGVAVPLATSHPPAELEYVIRDAEAKVVLAHPDFAATLRAIEPGRGWGGGRVRVLGTDLALERTAPHPPLPDLGEGRRAMMVYTSGTTGRPKGVVTTHANLRAQVTSLITAWEWSADDAILLVLPLHHVHGIVNVVACALWAGARCDMHAKFDPARVWSRFADGDLTLFMAVPTIYHKLIAAWDAAPRERQRAWSAGCSRLRLMVSGSAALPIQTLERWREISGQVLLERYGMTEIGMALSNPIRGERRPGFVGAPLPGVEVRLVEGEIEVRGPNVFLEYWRRPEATAQAFSDGWFRTGDMAVVERGAYRILGRASVDIIKSGGYKISALEIEEVLRAHPAIAECAVVGVEDAEWGERICAAVELRDKGGGEQGAGRDATLGLEELQQWAKQRLAPYKVPRALRCVAALPRNAMGKVMKPEVVKLFQS